MTCAVKDRHVLAAAVDRANIIVTFNVKDFPARSVDKYKIRVLTPDKFVWSLFCRYLNLLLEKQHDIFACADYFFCQPLFSYVSWPYLGGDGPLSIGYLLLGWQSQLLIQPCPGLDCRGEVLITSFCGSILSGGNSWSGYCINCQNRKTGSRTDIRFYELVDFVLKLRQSFPVTIEQIEAYDTLQFTWGGNGLAPAINKRIVQMPVANPVTLEVLINELESGQIRAGKPANVCLLKNGLELKPFSSH